MYFEEPFRIQLITWHYLVISWLINMKLYKISTERLVSTRDIKAICFSTICFSFPSSKIVIIMIIITSM